MILQGDALRSDWHGCYRDGWQGLVVPEAFAHPAKFSRGLIRRIYDHMREEGWLAPGSVILDPFGGVALGALDAMRIGCQWVGIELEEKFVALGAQNIARWNSRFSSLPGWGSAVILQGDSRNLLAWNFAGPPADAVVGSPPFSHSHKGNPDDGQKGVWGMDPKSRQKRDYLPQADPSNLGNLPDKGFEAVVGSPPFSQSQQVDNRTKMPSALSSTWRKRFGDITDGSSPGQLAAMPEGTVDSVISSPPYEGSLNSDHHGLDLEKCGPWRGGRTLKGKSEKLLDDISYHAGPENLGNASADTFWSAARMILEQCFLAIRPGGHAIFVTKRFVRNGKIVEFSQQWAQLCEAVGFRVVHWHRAWLVEDNGTQQRTDGGETRLTKEKKSFFRRLAEKKGSPRIDWEDVICLERS